MRNLRPFVQVVRVSTRTMTHERVKQLVDVSDDEHQQRWSTLVSDIESRFGRMPDVDAVLFLIGVQSVGRGYEPDLPKERKQSLIMEGSYLAFETIDLYRRMGLERNGFWIWEKMTNLPKLSTEDQEKLLQIGILNYFDRLP
ncbi:MAG: hypothetical protein ACC655_02905 [Rhodothermia bacterium]